MAAIRPNPTLSDDLISEILVREPVKSLLCFQSVCKAWLSLIKHPAFVKSQLRHAITIETDQTLVLSRFQRFQRFNHEVEMEFLLLHVDSREIVADLKFPYSRRTIISKIVGFANGIVCVFSLFANNKENIYLWNPAIRQSKLVPPSSIGRYGGKAFRFGFGYDPIDNDYKILRIVIMNYSMCAEVYSVNKNVWRKLPDQIDRRWTGDFNVCVNGFLCGIGCRGMMTFDLNKELLNCGIKLPVISRADIGHCIEFNNSVAVVIQWKGLDDDETDARRLDEKICIWTLNDDACLSGGGVEALWTPMFRIGLVMPGRYSTFGYFNKRDFLLLVDSDGYKWIWCNADKKEAKIIPVSVEMAAYHYSHYAYAYKYTESLVSLPGFEQVTSD